MNPPSTPSSVPTFGTNSDVPFIFQSPPPKSPYVHAWVPPDNFSPEKAFPQEEIRDVDMAEPSPPKPQETGTDGRRMVALGAVRRVFRSRQKTRNRARTRANEEDSETSWPSDDGSEDEGLNSGRPRIRKLSHHYTLNVPSPVQPKADTPYILLG